jgi:cell division initiation protein
MRKDKVISQVLGPEIMITPSDLYNIKFKRALVGGYEAKEVEELLERVGDALEALATEVRSLRERNEDQKASLEEYRQIEATLRSALVSSQKFSEDIIAAAQREAHTLLEEARLKAAQLPETIAREIQQLERQRERLRAELLAIFDTHKKLLDAVLGASPPAVAKNGKGSAGDDEDRDAV